VRLTSSRSRIIEEAGIGSTQAGEIAREEREREEKYKKKIDKKSGQKCIHWHFYPCVGGEKTLRAKNSSRVFNRLGLTYSVFLVESRKDFVVDNCLLALKATQKLFCLLRQGCVQI